MAKHASEISYSAEWGGLGVRAGVQGLGEHKSFAWDLEGRCKWWGGINFLFPGSLLAMLSVVKG